MAIPRSPEEMFQIVEGVPQWSGEVPSGVLSGTLPRAQDRQETIKFSEWKPGAEYSLTIIQELFGLDSRPREVAYFKIEGGPNAIRAAQLYRSLAERAGVAADLARCRLERDELQVRREASRQQILRTVSFQWLTDPLDPRNPFPEPRPSLLKQWFRWIAPTPIYAAVLVGPPVPTVGPLSFGEVVTMIDLARYVGYSNGKVQWCDREYSVCVYRDHRYSAIVKRHDTQIGGYVQEPGYDLDVRYWAAREIIGRKLQMQRSVARVTAQDRLESAADAIRRSLKGR